MSEYRISEPTLNASKAKEIILYLLHRFPHLNEKTLQQILYFIDFDYYETHEEHLIGFTWKKSSIS